MSDDKPSDNMPSSPVSAVPTPTIRPEASETLPLNKAHSSFTKRSWCCSDDTDGLNAIIGFFTAFTLAVTIALIAQIHSGAFEVAPHGSVTTDSEICSAIGTDFLKKGGNAVDAAVASTICMGVVHPHMTGLGGGGFLMVYDHKRRRSLDTIDFREIAPLRLPTGPLSAGDGSAFVGVPGFLRGLHAVHEAYGLFSWSDVIEPSIHLAREGVTVSQSLMDSKELVGGQGSLGNEAFVHLLEQVQPDANLLQSRLADTLEVIAEHGPDALYNGSLSIKLLSTLSNQSLMSLDDLSLYREEHRKPLVGTIGDYSIMVPGAPSGGPLLLAVLGILGTPEENPGWWNQDTQARNLQRVAETLRLAALYHAQLGDPDHAEDLVFNATLQMTDPHEWATLRREVEEGEKANWSNWQLPQSAGSFVGVIDTHDLYVSVISGLNSKFGSRLMTPLGFVLNDALNNFTPLSTATAGVAESSNMAAPGRRPLSLAVPAIVVKPGAPCGRRFVLGSSDASVAAQALSNILATQEDIGRAVEQPRVALHTRNISIEAWHTPLFEKTILTTLEGSGYHVLPMRPPYTGVNIVQKRADMLSAHSDSRGGGSAISY